MSEERGRDEPTARLPRGVYTRFVSPALDQQSSWIVFLFLLSSLLAWHIRVVYHPEVD